MAPAPAAAAIEGQTLRQTGPKSAGTVAGRERSPLAACVPLDEGGSRLIGRQCLLRQRDTPAFGSGGHKGAAGRAGGRGGRGGRAGRGGRGGRGAKGGAKDDAAAAAPSPADGGDFAGGVVVDAVVERSAAATSGAPPTSLRAFPSHAEAPVSSVWMLVRLDARNGHALLWVDPFGSEWELLLGSHVCLATMPPWPPWPARVFAPLAPLGDGANEGGGQLVGEVAAKVGLRLAVAVPTAAELCVCVGTVCAFDARTGRHLLRLDRSTITSAALTFDASTALVAADPTDSGHDGLLSSGLAAAGLDRTVWLALGSGAYAWRKMPPLPPGKLGALQPAGSPGRGRGGRAGGRGGGRGGRGGKAAGGRGKGARESAADATGKERNIPPEPPIPGNAGALHVWASLAKRCLVCRQVL
ncbi:hypothetical protein T492DRAFT_848912 [Pavlovales sp. CCMP2436]|nr:hypothetical protein T492DRAFT_848912 [Pavlovales sp. CCMP2436]